MREAVCWCTCCRDFVTLIESKYEEKKKMARYIREVELNKPEDFVQYIVTDFLTKHGFKLVEFKGEMIYRAGDGFF